MSEKIIFATGNAGKLKEIREILKDLNREIVTMREAGFEGEIEENGTTFRENAEIKAKAVWEKTGGIVRKVRLMVPLCVPLLVSSVRKTNSAAIAAEVRGFNLRTATSGYKEYPFVAADVAAMAGSLALVAIAVALGVLL